MKKLILVLSIIGLVGCSGNVTPPLLQVKTATTTISSDQILGTFDINITEVCYEGYIYILFGVTHGSLSVKYIKNELGVAVPQECPHE